jgi:hypothetical protein
VPVTAAQATQGGMMLPATSVSAGGVPVAPPPSAPQPSTPIVTPIPAPAVNQQ